MQTIGRSNGTAVSSLQYESTAGSFDCSEEFSLDHWIRVSKLVQESETPDLSVDVYCPSADLKTTSEMESATADEHFARNIV